LGKIFLPSVFTLSKTSELNQHFSIALFDFKFFCLAVGYYQMLRDYLLIVKKHNIRPPLVTSRLLNSPIANTIDTSHTDRGSEFFIF
jgi:hypothetical protein